MQQQQGQWIEDWLILEEDVMLAAQVMDIDDDGPRLLLYIYNNKYIY